MRLLLACIVVLSTAQISQAEGEDSASGQRLDKPKKQNKKLELVGRLFVRDTIVRAPVTGLGHRYTHDLGVGSARISAEYRRGKVLKGVVEVDFADGKGELKDGYLRIRPVKELTVKVGRFKRPISPIALESAWRLPTVERGLLSEVDLSTNRSATDQPFGGRGEGVQVSYEFKEAPLEPEVTIGLFQHTTQTTRPLDISEDFDLDPYGRVELRLLHDNDLELRTGATVAAITHVARIDDAGNPEIEHAPWASLDLALELAGLRFMVEAFAGTSLVVGESSGEVGSWTIAARGIVSYRVDDLGQWLRRLEPFVSASVLDLRRDEANDGSWELGGGVAMKLQKDLRLQVHVRRVDNDNDVLYGTVGSWSSFVQLGATF